MTAPNRRWPHFGLRTLFVVVTLFACWLGWSHRQVDKREFILEAIRERGGAVRFAETTAASRLPLLWWWFGAVPVERINLSNKLYSQEDIEYAKSMFPEAKAALYDPEKPIRKGYIPLSTARKQPLSTYSLEEHADSIRERLMTSNRTAAVQSQAE